MSDTVNFEALGHYVDATERAQAISQQYNTIMKKLEYAIRGAQHPSQGHRYQMFNFDDAKALLSQGEQLYRSLEAAIREANLYAADCAKPTLTIA